MNNRIENKPLYGSYYRPLDTSQYEGKSFAEQLLVRVGQLVAENGDIPWLSNGAKQVLGESKVFGEGNHGLAEVEPRSKQMARILHHRFGIKRGDVIHLVMPSNTEMYFPILGTWLLQGVVSPADPSLSAEVISIQLRQIKAKVVVCCLGTLDKVRAALDILGEDIPVIVMDGVDKDGREGRKEMSLDSLRKSESSEGYPDIPSDVKVEDNEEMLICWSSGTTGRPKGILHGSNMFFKFLYDANESTQSPCTKSLQTTCLFHLGGFCNPISALIKGTENIIIANEDLDDNIGLIIKVAAEKQVDSLTCGSHHLIQLAAVQLKEGDEPAPSVGMIAPMGTNVYDGIYSDLRDKFPSLSIVVNIYGQSEGGAGVSVATTQENIGMVMCAGVQVVDPDTKEPLGPDMVGEITYKTDCTMIRYIQHPEENEKFFGKDGFCHSGDLGHYDADGVLYFDGRLKELIKYKNNHLYPNELEEIILSHEGVEDAAVFGKPEATVQELVTAVVVKKDNHAVSQQDLEKLVAEKVEDYKTLRGGVHFVEKIPRNPQGKILRKSLACLLK